MPLKERSPETGVSVLQAASAALAYHSIASISELLIKDFTYLLNKLWHIRVGTCSSSMTFIVWRSRDDSKLRQLLYLQDQMDSYVKAKPLLLSFH